MKPTKSNLVCSWVTLILAITYILIFFDNEVFIIIGAFIATPLYFYFRGDVDKGIYAFEEMPESWKIYIAGYYLFVASIIIGKIINNPNVEPFEIGGRIGYLKLILLIGIPFLLVWVKREIHLYKEAGNEKI